MRPRLLSGRPCVDDRICQRSSSPGQHPVPDDRHQEPGTVYRVGRQAQGLEGVRLQHVALHPPPGID